MPRRRFLVSYDITEPGRLRAVFTTMKAYGTWTQYSVFVCDLSGVEMIRLETDLLEIINEHEDKVMIIDLGEVERSRPFRFLGVGSPLPERGPQIV